jgi:transcriptional regulator with XRE-family HTH domain
VRPLIRDPRRNTYAVQPPAAVAVGLALRTLRTARHVGMRQLAARLGLRAQDLSNWEIAKRIPPITVVAQLLGALHADRVTVKRILNQAGHADDPAFVDAHHRDHAVLAWHYEHLATDVVEWAPTLIPDLLRTPAHDLYLLNHPLADPGYADAQSFAEPTRRNDLVDANRHYTFLVGDTALRACPPQMRTDQLSNLKHIAARPNITLRVIPADVCAPGLISPFTLYRHHKVTLAAAVHHHRASTYLADRDTLTAYQRATQMLRRHAVELQSVDETLQSTQAGPTELPDSAEAS